ncbi:MAG: IS3 family transposase [Pseudomonas sp.]
MCRVLEVSRSGYFAWLNRAPSKRTQRDAELKAAIGVIYSDSDGTYGRLRIHEELKDHGEKVGGKRVARLMKESGLEGASRLRNVFTTRRDRDARPAPDLVDRAKINIIQSGVAGARTLGLTRFRGHFDLVPVSWTLTLLGRGRSPQCHVRVCGRAGSSLHTGRAGSRMVN